MDILTDDTEVLNPQQRTEPRDILNIQWDKWDAREMTFTPEKVKWLWEEMQNYRTLFSDLTRGDMRNFVNLIALPDSFWIEVVDRESGKIVGVMYVMDIEKVIDASVHIIFFDRKPVAKAVLCRLALEWIFRRFPFQRMSAYIPAFYWQTLTLAKKVGFKEEGRRRRAMLIGNKWVDEVVLGILRDEVI